MSDILSKTFNVLHNTIYIVQVYTCILFLPLCIYQCGLKSDFKIEFLLRRRITRLKIVYFMLNTIKISTCKSFDMPL